MGAGQYSGWPAVSYFGALSWVVFGAVYGAITGWCGCCVSRSPAAAMAACSRREQLWRFWLWWVLASTVGWAVGGFGGWAVVGSLPRGIIGDGTVVVVVGGFVLGALQWLVLRRQVARAGWWVVASIAAMAVVGVLVVALDEGAVVAGGGLVVGVLQWLVLRRQVALAGWWVPASAVGWVVGGFVSGIVGDATGVSWIAAAGWAVLGVVYGAITGAVLVWLLRHRAAGADDAVSAPL